ncbi:hypothetical protein HWV62_33661 [Athelia sp. TMB]|nr:hypothetical protein HWV62_33661 [Athelia sp. TMB]
MSLSNLLLGSSSKKAAKPAIDSGLDALFRSTAASNAVASTSVPKQKRKSRDVTDAPDHDREAKKAKSASKHDAGSSKKGKKKAAVDAEIDSAPVEAKKSKKKKTKEKKALTSDDDEDSADLETAYASKGASSAAVDSDPEVEQSEGDDNDDVDPSTLVHESVAKTGKKKSSAAAKPKAKYIPEDETPEKKDARTIFIGNLSVEVAQKRPLLKQLQRHILAHIPSAKIESTRFRSIPFQKPTSKLPTSDDEDASSKPPAPRQHDRDRMAAWRAAAAEQDKDEVALEGDEKKFLNPGQKKKIAFINGEFHSTADSVHAYIVFAHPAPPAARAANLPPLPPTMDPYEAAQSAVEKCDGSLFLERMIRVDLASKERVAGDGSGNPKLSVFVGNLDFGCKEEDLRVFFEGVVSTERGPPGLSGGETEGEEARWVTRVRIVRDKETQLGKGFAYVQFADRECVDEILSMEETKLKFAKRKLRVQRCKTLTAASKPKTTPNPKAPAIAKARAPATAIAIPSVPKGDPNLGEKLAHLAKDERKQIKSSDADRVARRLAKKKARSALEKQGVRAQVKDRDRTRKSMAEKKAAPRKKEVSKGRIRSEKSVSKRNAKK